MVASKTATPSLPPTLLTAAAVARSSAAPWPKKRTTICLRESARATGAGTPGTVATAPPLGGAAGLGAGFGFGCRGLGLLGRLIALTLGRCPMLAAPSSRAGLPPAWPWLTGGGATACATGSAAVSRAPRAARKVEAMSIAPTRVRSSGRETAIRALSDAGGRMFSRYRGSGYVPAPGRSAHHLDRWLAPGPHRPGCAHPGGPGRPGRPPPGSLPTAAHSAKGATVSPYTRSTTNGGRIDPAQTERAHGLRRSDPPSQPDTRAIYEQIRGHSPLGHARAQIPCERPARSGVRLSTDTSPAPACSSAQTTARADPPAPSTKARLPAGDSPIASRKP